MTQLYSIPIFNGGATSALGAMPINQVRGVGDAQAQTGVWNWLDTLTPLAQQAAATELQNLGVPAGLIQSGQAVAYKAQGYQFAGGTIQLRSGLTGTPMTAPNGQKYLLTTAGSAVAYSPSDVGAPATGSATGADNSNLTPILIGAGLLVAFLALR